MYKLLNKLQLPRSMQFKLAKKVLSLFACINTVHSSFSSTLFNGKRAVSAHARKLQSILKVHFKNIWVDCISLTVAAVCCSNRLLEQVACTKLYKQSHIRVTRFMIPTIWYWIGIEVREMCSLIQNNLLWRMEQHTSLLNLFQTSKVL